MKKFLPCNIYTFMLTSFLRMLVYADIFLLKNKIFFFLLSITHQKYVHINDFVEKHILVHEEKN